MAHRNTEVERYLQFVAAVRIGYGVLAYAAPELCAKCLGFRYDDEVRGLNTFVGSRDIAIGLHSLLATRYDRQLDAVLVNQACEVCDSLLVARELERGRRGIFAWMMVPFNLAQHVQWLRAHRLLRS